MNFKNRNYTEFILGAILLIPPLCSVLFFLMQLIFERPTPLENLNTEIWNGSIKYFMNIETTRERFITHTTTQGGGGGGFTSALPFYFGFLAISGAILISGSKKKAS